MYFGLLSLKSLKIVQTKKFFFKYVLHMISLNGISELYNYNKNKQHANAMGYQAQVPKPQKH